MPLTTAVASAGIALIVKKKEPFEDAMFTVPLGTYGIHPVVMLCYVVCVCVCERERERERYYMFSRKHSLSGCDSRSSKVCERIESD